MTKISKKDSNQKTNNEKTASISIIIVPPRYVFFADIFSTPKGHNVIINVLREHNLIAPNSGIWIDSKKASKKMLVTILKKLRVLGYYKNHHNLTTPEIRQICINSFAIGVSVSTVEHTTHDSSDVDFLPPFFAN